MFKIKKWSMLSKIELYLTATAHKKSLSDHVGPILSVSVITFRKNTAILCP